MVDGCDELHLPWLLAIIKAGSGPTCQDAWAESIGCAELCMHPHLTPRGTWPGCAGIHHSPSPHPACCLLDAVTRSSLVRSSPLWSADGSTFLFVFFFFFASNAVGHVGMLSINGKCRFHGLQNGPGRAASVDACVGLLAASADSSPAYHRPPLRVHPDPLILS